MTVDHVIRSLEVWLETYEDNAPEDRDERAIRCIRAAIAELRRYYGS